MKSVTFEGEATGDGECFCWKVDFETFKTIERHWENEIQYRQICNIDSGLSKNEGVYDNFFIYPNQVISHLTDQYKKKYKITVTLEEI